MAELKNLPNNDVLYRCWPAAQAKAALLLVHGLGAHSARWDFFGDYFSKKGYSCYAIELKGFGQTPERPRGHIGSFTTYYHDILHLAQAIKLENPGKKVFVFGESLGGLIVFNFIGFHPQVFNGAVLMSPAFANAMKFSGLDYLALPFFLLFDRKHLNKMPFTSDMCTRDTAYQKVMDDNPDEYRYASVNLLLNTLLAQQNSASLAKKLRIAFLFLLSGKDQLVSPEAAKQIYEKIAYADKTLIYYPEMYHALYIDLDREKVFADALSWLEKRI